MRLKTILETRKVSKEKFETEPLEKQENFGRNAALMSKIRRKGEFEHKGKARTLNSGKQITYYIKKYKNNKPCPKEVNGVLEYATYKIVDYYSKINPEIKIPRMLHLSFEETDGQFTLATSSNMKEAEQNLGLRSMAYRNIANSNMFFFTLIGYADTHGGNIILTKNGNYLIDFDYAFLPIPDKILKPFIVSNPQIKNSILKSYSFYKKINMYKVKSIIDDTFAKARRLLEKDKDKINENYYNEVSTYLSKLHERMVTNFYYNKKAIDDYIKSNNIEKEFEKFDPNKPFNEYTYAGPDIKNLPTSSSLLTR